jgi:hypothetical protein
VLWALSHALSKSSGTPRLRSRSLRNSSVGSLEESLVRDSTVFSQDSVAFSGSWSMLEATANFEEPRPVHLASPFRRAALVPSILIRRCAVLHCNKGDSVL